MTLFNFYLIIAIIYWFLYCCLVVTSEHISMHHNMQTTYYTDRQKYCRLFKLFIVDGLFISSLWMFQPFIYTIHMTYKIMRLSENHINGINTYAPIDDIGRALIQLKFKKAFDLWRDRYIKEFKMRRSSVIKFLTWFDFISSDGSVLGGIKIDGNEQLLYINGHNISQYVDEINFGYKRHRDRFPITINIRFSSEQSKYLTDINGYPVKPSPARSSNIEPRNCYLFDHPIKAKVFKSDYSDDIYIEILDFDITITPDNWKLTNTMRTIEVISSHDIDF